LSCFIELFDGFAAEACLIAVSRFEANEGVERFGIIGAVCIKLNLINQSVFPGVSRRFYKPSCMSACSEIKPEEKKNENWEKMNADV